MFVDTQNPLHTFPRNFSVDEDAANLPIGVRTGGCSPPESGKAIIFRANAIFFGQKSAAKNEKKYLLNAKKTEFIPSAKMKCPKSGIFG